MGMCGGAVNAAHSLLHEVWEVLPRPVLSEVRVYTDLNVPRRLWISSVHWLVRALHCIQCERRQCSVWNGQLDGRLGLRIVSSIPTQGAMEYDFHSRDLR